MDIIDIILAKKAASKAAQDVTVIIEEVEDIESKIPNDASSDNKLTDKAYVDKSINNASAFFRGTYATRAALFAIQWQTITENAEHYVSNNDYVYIEADETHNNQVWRYCYKYEAGAQDNGWYAQYMINEGPFTQEQWAAINSGIDTVKTTKISSISNDFSTTKAYFIGDYAFYNGELYVFKQDHNAGMWDSTQVVKVTVSEELKNKQENLNFDDTPIKDSINPVVSNGVYMDTFITRGMIADIEEGEDTPETFGVEWDYSQSSPILTRTEGAIDFSNPVPATSNSEVGSSPFDDIYPWSEMKCYNVVNGEIMYNSTDPEYSETAYDTVVYIPEFYYSAKKDTINQKWTWSIASRAMEGYEKHPGSGRYIGRFHTSGGSSGVFTKGGVTPLANVTRANFRTYSHNKGTNWWQIDLATWSALQMLYLVEYANWDSQTTLGKGQNTGSVKATGGTTGAVYHSIQRTGVSGNMYRWVENPFSNLYTWVDGYVGQDRAAYISTNAASYGDTITGMIATGITLPSSNNYIGNFGYSEQCPWTFIPNEIGGSDTTKVTDYVYSSTGARVLSVGGGFNGGAYCGFFYFNASNSTSGADTYRGSRLIFYFSEP